MKKSTIKVRHYGKQEILEEEKARDIVSKMGLEGWELVNYIFVRGTRENDQEERWVLKRELQKSE